MLEQPCRLRGRDLVGRLGAGRDRAQPAELVEPAFAGVTAVPRDELMLRVLFVDADDAGEGAAAIGSRARTRSEVFSEFFSEWPTRRAGLSRDPRWIEPRSALD